MAWGEVGVECSVGGLGCVGGGGVGGGGLYVGVWGQEAAGQAGMGLR